MRYSVFSLLLLVLLTGCKVYYPNGKQNYGAIDTLVQNPYFARLNEERLYRATIRFYGKEMTGMFVAKRISQDDHRIVLTSDLGNTLFDITISKDQHLVNYVMQDLDRKIILHTLVRDFRALTQTTYRADYQNLTANQFLSIYNGKRYFLKIDDQGTLTKIEMASKYKRAFEIQFKPDSLGKLDSFNIKHRGIKLKMDFVNIPF
ncbi:hypothetical protein [Sphingobacterium siyangense]|jgi:hypothetical protein|uniref:hypothetical protein n=1 Tax=Sphingobacterium siyangense TaxID=459529 RepID=UPI0028B08B9A|nr:hypothetical protein [Sphingobacterium siyangense]